ncbi:MAG: hypothetical protein ACO326_09000, partial [Burkholderiaceae bacterium]
MPSSVLLPTNHHQKGKIGCTKGSHTSSDCHAVMSHLLRDIREINEKGGIRCRLRLPAKGPGGEAAAIGHGAKAICPCILCHLGGSEGGGKGCCIRAKPEQICRLSKAPRSQCGDPGAKFDNKAQAEVIMLIREMLSSDCEDSATKLKELSAHPAASAHMEGINLLSGGTSGGRGVFELFPPEVMHLIQKGWRQHLLEGFCVLKRLKTGTAGSSDDPELSTRFIIPESQLDLVSDLAHKVGTHLPRNSDADLPRTMFEHGVTSDAH